MARATTRMARANPTRERLTLKDCFSLNLFLSLDRFTVSCSGKDNDKDGKGDDNDGKKGDNEDSKKGDDEDDKQARPGQ
jgi:hypothetical protein